MRGKLRVGRLFCDTRNAREITAVKGDKVQWANLVRVGCPHHWTKKDSFIKWADSINMNEQILSKKVAKDFTRKLKEMSEQVKEAVGKADKLESKNPRMKIQSIPLDEIVASLDRAVGWLEPFAK